MSVPTGRQPDILEVIADLSSDEVFTPPKVANAVLDLLPTEVWSDPDLRFLDPGTKTGVFLREVTKRLMVGLTELLPDEQERLEHILRNQVYGIGITELTSLVSRRSVYCSKTADGPKSIVAMASPAGNVWFERVEHSYDPRGKCTECGASESQMERDNRENYAYAFIHDAGRVEVEKEVGMKFDVIVGNPPYQMEADDAGQNIVAIYHHFVEQALELNPRFITMVIPSRWMASGRGLEGFRQMMLSGGHLRSIVDYPNSAELFPSVDLKSGICYFLWDRDHQGRCDVTHRRGDTSLGPTVRDLDEFDVFVRDERALGVLRKVLERDEPSLSELVSARDPFGSNLTSRSKLYRRTRSPGCIRIYGNLTSAKQGPMWIQRSAVSRNLDLIDEWKVLLPAAGPGNSGGHVIPDVVLGRPATAAPGSVCTISYLVLGPLRSEEDCASAASYLRTRFLRFLVSLRKPSQHAFKETYKWVPQQAWDHPWTDEELYAKYGITEEEQAYIAEMIREMPE